MARLPYLMNTAGLGPKVGYIYGTRHPRHLNTLISGSFCMVAVVYAWFYIPETRGRSLEELDELFEMRVPAWRFAATQTNGAGRRVTAIERDEVLGEEKIEMGLREDVAVGQESDEAKV